MKFSTGALLCLMASGVSAKKTKKSKKEDEVVCPETDLTEKPTKLDLCPFYDYKHYLVGLMTFSHDYVPAILMDHTTARRTDVGPLQNIPNVGITDISDILDKTETVDPKTGKVTAVSYSPKKGTYYTMVGEGYGTSKLSDDFPLHYHRIKFEKPMVYNHAGTRFDIYHEVDVEETILITDPDKHIGWTSQWDGHALDVQVVYAAPANWQNDWVPDRVLTGRDLSPEGMATIRDDCAVVAEKWGPSIFAMDPITGVVKSGLVPTPDVCEEDVVNELDEVIGTVSVLCTDQFLTTVSDKQHCYLHEVVANECGIVDDKRINDNGYYDYQKDPITGKKVQTFVTKFTLITPEQGWAGIVRMGGGGQNPLVGMFHSAVGGEASHGARIYQINPGDCTKDCPPEIVAFLGWYPFCYGANRIAAFTPIPGSQTRILVHEHTTGFPSGRTFPRDMPDDRLCIVNLNIDVVGEVKNDKICILNFIHISDPYDVDRNGLDVYAHSQMSNGGLQIIDNYCVLIGTDNGFPLSNDDYDLEGLGVETVPFYTEAVEDNRFVFVCFIEPIFAKGYHFAGGRINDFATP